MKCIQKSDKNDKNDKNDKSDKIVRVKDNEAAELVGKGLATYVSRAVWKKANPETHTANVALNKAQNGKSRRKAGKMNLDNNANDNSGGKPAKAEAKAKAKEGQKQ